MLISLLRTIILYVIVTAAVRLMGKRQVGELQSSELVITMLISELAAIPMQETGTPLLSGVVPILTLVVCEIMVSVLMMKCRWFRRLVCGSPVVLIRSGRMDQKQMSRLRYTVEDLSEALRLQGVFDPGTVDMAMIETNGQLSVLKNASAEPPDAKTLGVSAKTEFWAIVVDDGRFCAQSAQLVGCSREWIDNVLKKEKCLLRDVFLLTANTEKKYRLVRRE